jgi:hypothetical protein
VVGSDPLDAEATAAWLVGPMAEYDEVLLTEWPRSAAATAPASGRAPAAASASSSSSASAITEDGTGAPSGDLGIGVVQALDDPGRRFVVRGMTLGHDAATGGGSPWMTHLELVTDDPRTLRSDRPHVAGPDDPREGLVFHDGSRAYAFRSLRDEDAVWVSRFDVGLGAYDLRLLVALMGEIRDGLDDPKVEFRAAREAAEELVALVAEQGTVVFALHYMLLDGRRVVNPQFRDGGDWSDEIPYLTDLWQAEARRVIDEGLATPDPENLIDDEPPTNDPFMLLGVAEYLQIHPTMARAFMELFDRGHPIPASIARLTEGHADDLVRPGGAGGWESEPWGSASSGSLSSDALRRRTAPMRRIDLMRVLYDISLEFSTRR